MILRGKFCRSRLAVLAMAAALAGCAHPNRVSSLGNEENLMIRRVNVYEDYGATPEQVLAGALALKLITSVSFGNMLTGAAMAGAAHFVYDPLAPNWDIAEREIDPSTYVVAMRMKRFHNGGDGEGWVVLQRRAEQLMLAQKSGAYEIARYAEGIDSSTPFARRYASAVIRLAQAR